MKSKEEIYKWLSQHDWYESFKTKTIHHYNQIASLDEYLSKLIKENKPETIICSAFYWPATNEGWYFWDKINNEYLKWLKTMKQTIEIEVPEGKKAVWKDGKVVFEDIKPELPKTWEEFCDKHPEVQEEYFIAHDSVVRELSWERKRDACEDRNLLPSKEAAEAYLALMQLHQLRDCYRQGWVPDWNNIHQYKYCIEKYTNDSHVNHIDTTDVHFLAFQTQELAEEFLYNFEFLIEKAGDLI